MGQDAYIIFKTTPFEGFKLGRVYRGMNMIAIPQKKVEEAKANNKDLCVMKKGVNTGKKSAIVPSYMIIDRNEVALAYGEFEDKWGREGKYTLCYYEWKPIAQNTLFG